MEAVVGLKEELFEQMGRPDWEDGGTTWAEAWGMVPLSLVGAVESDPASENVFVNLPVIPPLLRQRQEDDIWGSLALSTEQVLLLHRPRLKKQREVASENVMMAMRKAEVDTKEIACSAGFSFVVAMGERQAALE